MIKNVPSGTFGESINDFCCVVHLVVYAVVTVAIVAGWCEWVLWLVAPVKGCGGEDFFLL